MLQGSRSYVDASTQPILPNSHPREAGLGIFILNFQVQPAQAIYIQAKLQTTTSVIMAEAAILALASVVVDRLGLTVINYLSDYEQLVQFLNTAAPSDPPDRRIRPFAQFFSNKARNRDSKIFKIHR